MASKKAETRKVITMRDVAELAGVSQSTVSRVLNAGASGAVPISAETARRVQDIAQQLGYRPNLTARSLRGQRTMLIGMMIADISNPYYHLMLRKVQDIARSRQFDVILADTNHDPTNELHFIEGLMRRPVDGVILTPYHLAEQDLGRLIERTGAAVVVVSRRYRLPAVDHVYVDDERGAYEATRWLIEQRGHRRIAFIGVPGTRPGERRLSAFRRAMREAGLGVPAEYVKDGDFTSATGSRLMRELLQLRERPTAVFACNDLMALGCILTAQAMGLNVPGDVAVVGFDDIPQATWIHPKLTTVAQHPIEIGAQLAKAVFERIEGTVTGSGRDFIISPELVVRESA